MTKIAVVTGANKGIGFEIVKKIAQETKDVHIVMTVRDEGKGERAMNSMKQDIPDADLEVAQLDIADEDSIANFRVYMEKKHKVIDMLVHNAGMAYNKDDATPFDQQVTTTLHINYYGTKKLNEALMPLVKKSTHGTIVFMTSEDGCKSLHQCSDEVQQRWKQENMRVGDIDKLVHDFAQAAQRGGHEKEGWPSHAYGVSKLALMALCKVLAREEPMLLINAACPGFCQTDLTHHKGERTPEEGAEMPARLALHPPQSKSGEVWHDSKIINVF